MRSTAWNQKQLQKLIIFVLLIWVFSVGCIPWYGATNAASGAVGSVSYGVLLGGSQLEPQGEGYKFYHKRDRRWGTDELTALILRVSKRLSKSEGGKPVLVGDLSAKGGGRISMHRSHRTGLDVDMAFFVRDATGKEKTGYPLYKYDRWLVGESKGDVLFFDDKKNWELVAALIEDKEIEVQWIFISNGLKARLLSYALLYYENLDTIARAAYILREPSDSAAHDDHFHIRIYCLNKEQGNACFQRPPKWNWANQQHNEELMPSKEELLKMASYGL